MACYEKSTQRQYWQLTAEQLKKYAPHNISQRFGETANISTRRRAAAMEAYRRERSSYNDENSVEELTPQEQEIMQCYYEHRITEFTLMFNLPARVIVGIRVRICCCHLL